MTELPVFVLLTYLFEYLLNATIVHQICIKWYDKIKKRLFKKIYIKNHEQKSDIEFKNATGVKYVLK